MVREALLRGAGLAAAALLGFAQPGHRPRARHRPTNRRATHEAARASRRAPFDASSVIGGPSSCPRPDAVWGELVTLVPPRAPRGPPPRRDARQDSARGDRRSRRAVPDPRGRAGPRVPRREPGLRLPRAHRGGVRGAGDRSGAAGAVPAPAAPAAAPPPTAQPAPPPVDDRPSPRARLDLGATVVGGLGPERPRRSGREPSCAGRRGAAGSVPRRA